MQGCLRHADVRLHPSEDQRVPPGLLDCLLKLIAAEAVEDQLRDGPDIWNQVPDLGEGSSQILLFGQDDRKSDDFCKLEESDHVASHLLLVGNDGHESPLNVNDDEGAVFPRNEVPARRIIPDHASRLPLDAPLIVHRMA